MIRKANYKTNLQQKNKTAQINIQGKMVGDRYPNFIVAEIGFNHEGDIGLALKMIEAAARAGVDAVKFQTYRASNLVLESEEHFNIIKRGELSLSDHRYLADTAKANGISFLSTPYCRDSIALLEKIGVCAYKIASMDLTNIPLIRYISKLNKPIILSTGMASLQEIREAVETIRSEGNNKIVLLHCISKYPALLDEANLNTIIQLKREFDLPVGYSDHVLGNTASLAAVALGACMIEKHFTIDKTLPGPDHKISSDPNEMSQLVHQIRDIEVSLGKSCLNEKRPDRKENLLFRRSIYAKVGILKGARITEDMVKCVRPVKGLLPKELDRILGKVAKRNIRKETPITLNLIK